MFGKKMIFIATPFIAAIGIGFITIYNQGYQKGFEIGLVNHQQANIILSELSSCQINASEKSSALSQAQVALSQSSPMIISLQNHISECDTEVSELKEKLAFYETVYGANVTAGFKLREFKLNQISEQQFEVLGLVSKSGDDQFRGCLKLTLTDEQDHKLEKIVDMRFKHFKEVKHQFDFKEDWQPQTLELQLLTQEASVEAQQAILLNRSNA